MPADRSAHGASSGKHANLLIRSLEPSDLRLLQPHLTRILFAPGETIVSPDQPLTRVVFPETFIVGLREGLAPGNRPDVGMIGPEGMVGFSVLLGSDHTPLRGVAEMLGGSALAIAPERLREACHISGSLNRSLLRYVHNFMTQMACSISSNATDAIERRVARWMLMLHDRADADILWITHDDLSSALNVRRASVTDCLHILEGDGLVRCTRGKIVVRDRKRLEAVAGTSYGLVEAHYRRDIGHFGRSAPAN